MKTLFRFIKNLKGYYRLQRDYDYDAETYSFIIEQYQEVLCGCTHTMSKPTYYARDIEGEIDRYYEDLYEEAMEELKSENTRLRKELELRDER